MAIALQFRKSIRYKFLVLIGLIFTLFTGILIAYTSYQTRVKEIETARYSAHNQAQLFADHLQQEFDRALQSSNVLSESFAALKTSKHPITRSTAINMLTKVLLDNPSFYGVYTAWEPNAFDGQDTGYINKKGHDPSGRFIPYLNRTSAGKVLLEPTLGYDGDWYMLMKNEPNDLVMDPFSYEIDSSSVLLVTTETPIEVEGQFYGLTGIDIAVNWLQKKAKEAVANHPEAVISVISQNGTLAAASNNDDWLGKRIDTLWTHGPAQLAKVQSNWSGDTWGEALFEVSFPVKFGNAPATWQVHFTIPTATILKTASTQMWTTLIIGLCMLIPALLIMGFFVQRMVRPITEMADVTQDMALGNLTDRTIKTTNDEIGLMKEALNDLLQGLLRTTQFAKEIGKGDLDADYSVLSDKDALGHALLTMRDQLKENANQEQMQHWTNHGLAKFGEILRSHNDNLSKLGQELISNLVKYLDASMAKLYVINEEEGDQFIELVATYAWERNKFIKERIEPGVGLVGQSVLDRKHIYLTELPSDFLNISSGLGDGKPSSVLIMPLKVNEEINGVIEIASFKNIEPHQIEFIQRLGESIAASISSVKVAEQTQSLLLGSKKQAEELRAQEEEMRQNMEELQATQEEMARAQEGLKVKETHLNGIVDHTTDSILLINQEFNVLVINKVLRDRYKGTEYSNIGPGTSILSIFKDPALLEEWKGYYSRGLAGEKFQFTLKSAVSKEVHTYRDYFIYPILHKGEVLCISVVSRDVTAQKSAEEEVERLKAQLANKKEK